MTVDIYAPTPQDGLSLAELELYHQIMDYRASLGLAPIPLSRGLTTTAGRHVVDTRENIWAAGLELPAHANLHSWHDAFYYDDHSAPDAMHGAPARLGTGYDAPGHEISAAGYLDSAAALDGWEHSPGHNAILTESGDWAGSHFAAIGIGLDTAYMDNDYQGRIYHVWFGDVRDPTGAPGIHGTGRDDSIVGTAFADWIDGHRGDDRIAGDGGADRILGEGGADRLSGGAAGDQLSGGWGGDVVSGGPGADRIWGGAGNDRLSGGSGRDLLNGDGGNDRLAAGPGGGRLDGGSGADRLLAGRNHDLLTGGAGPDVFVFVTPGQAGLGAARDHITEFQPGLDRLDLSGIDADATRAGNQGFALHGATLSGDPGTLAFAHGVLAADLDGDGAPDFEIALAGVATLGPHDILL